MIVFPVSFLCDGSASKYGRGCVCNKADCSDNGNNHNCNMNAASSHSPDVEPMCLKLWHAMKRQRAADSTPQPCTKASVMCTMWKSGMACETVAVPFTVWHVHFRQVTHACMAAAQRGLAWHLFQACTFGCGG